MMYLVEDTYLNMD